MFLIMVFILLGCVSSVGVAPYLEEITCFSAVDTGCHDRNEKNCTLVLN